MSPTRRDILKWLTATASGVAISPALAGLAHALRVQERASPVVWINEGGDHLNLLAALGPGLPSVLELAVSRWHLVHCPPLRIGPSFAPPPLDAPPIVILEVLPDAAVLHREAWPESAVADARAAILLGTDACYGGTRWSPEDVARMEDFCAERDTPLIKLPGLPVPPHHLIGTVAHLDLVGMPRLDRYRRPELYYGQTVCRACERRIDLEHGRFAAFAGEPGCLLQLGCKGPIAHNSCAVTHWNGGESWCVGAGGPCTACAEPGFPDHGGLGLYGRLPGDALTPRSPLLAHLEGAGWGLAALAGAGVALRLLRRALDGGAPGGGSGEQGG